MTRTYISQRQNHYTSLVIAFVTPQTYQVIPIPVPTALVDGVMTALALIEIRVITKSGV